MDLHQLVEKTSYRVVTEKYDSQHPDLPIVKLWDNLQQGVSPVSQFKVCQLYCLLILYIVILLWLHWFSGLDGIKVSVWGSGHGDWHPGEVGENVSESEQSATFLLSVAYLSGDDRNISNILPRYLGTNSLQKCNKNSDSLFIEVNPLTFSFHKLSSLQGCSNKITEIISTNATLFISILSGFLILGLYSII